MLHSYCGAYELPARIMRLHGAPEHPGCYNSAPVHLELGWQGDHGHITPSEARDPGEDHVVERDEGKPRVNNGRSGSLCEQTVLLEFGDQHARARIWLCAACNNSSRAT